MKKKIASLTLAMTLGLTAVATGIASASASTTTSAAISKYNQYIHADSYVKDELYNVADFRQKYASLSGTLAYQIVDRAIWYMENGYMVYGHGSDAYGKYGYEDCSGFTRLVFGDFGFSITGASASYDTVGTKVQGVGKKQVNGKWQLTGIENLRIGDILTWKQNDTISHVAIYMGTNRDGQPVVIGTRADGNPTALGTVDGWGYWWGEKFNSARRVLPDDAIKGMAGHTAKAPVIPNSYVLPPQKPVPQWTPPTGGQTQPTPQPTPQPQPTPKPQPTPSPQPQPTPSPQPSQPQAKKQYVVTQHGWVGLKASASLSSADVGRLQLGQKAELIKKANSYWYQIKWNGKTVYITTNSKYTKVITE